MRNYLLALFTIVLAPAAAAQVVATHCTVGGGTAEGYVINDDFVTISLVSFDFRDFEGRSLESSSKFFNVNLGPSNTWQYVTDTSAPTDAATCTFDAY